ncbi:SANT and BTB domain regulator of class switch recombination [Galleria mellonella]|uniref:SANT and BTB domain regulator of class switch recombination n=1 Tax=Galleria mellonella TaxID=7137 RepID=A0ABM3N230_GALME|nr:SANT and BTB domain regulator of class switch recombination [Galleria mellonella]
MSSPNSETDSTSMFMQKGDGKKTKSPTRSESSSRRNSMVKIVPAEVITVKDFFDFMKTAYQVYEHLEGDEDEGSKINWEELTKLTVINHVIEQQERDLLYQTAFAEPKPIVSKSDTAIEKKNSTDRIEKRFSCSELEGKGRRRSLPPEARVEMLGVWTEANLNCKLNDVINEGILDSILPYLVGYKKSSKTTSVYAPIIKKAPSNSTSDLKKPASFGGFVNEKESRDRLGRRKSSVVAAQERNNQKQDGEVEIHVCDEVKGLKKDFRCPQKLLVSKMGYFADVTAGQRLEDMDISVHCDIQIFDWLMRWVKRDSILVADWPLLDPHNVVPILVSASFLQMEPLLHDCLIYCHAHMNDIVKTSTNLACLSDALLTRLAAMYTNAELEAIRDRKDKVQSRLYCKMIMSLAEPVPETLRGHYATLATLFKCSKCNKLLGRHIAEQVPCQPASMRIDRRGNVISTHSKDQSWSLNEYITWLYGELRSWRRVYWRLWADCHFLRCQLCDSYFPAYQMEWCSHHEQSAHMFAVEGRPPLPAGRYPCCGERAYRFETITRNTGCQFREHVPDERLATDAAVMEVYNKFRDIIAMRPPQLMFPERLTRLVPRELGEDSGGRLQCKEVFWWEGIQLVPPRQHLGLLGKMYTSNNKFNPCARPGSPTLGGVRVSTQSLAGNCPGGTSQSPDRETKSKPQLREAKEEPLQPKKGIQVSGVLPAGGDATDDGGEQTSSDESEQSSASARSEEDAPPKRTPRLPRPRSNPPIKRGRAAGRQWAAALSARSNQDAQRRYEERAARAMRAALGRRAAPPPAPRRTPAGGVYVKLETEWRERHGQRTRSTASARPRQPANKFK